MNQEEIRKGFEQWATSNVIGFVIKYTDGNLSGQYRDMHTQAAWEAWQESFKLGYTAAMHQIAQSAKP